MLYPNYKRNPPKLSNSFMKKNLMYGILVCKLLSLIWYTCTSIQISVYPFHMIVWFSHLCKEVLWSFCGYAHTMESGYSLKDSGLCLTIAEERNQIRKEILKQWHNKYQSSCCSQMLSNRVGFRVFFVSKKKKKKKRLQFFLIKISF